MALDPGLTPGGYPGAGTHARTVFLEMAIQEPLPNPARRPKSGQDETPSSAAASKLGFYLPPELEASEPPEARGLKRDQVRLMVTPRAGGHTLHTRFDKLPGLLDSGDIVVVNTSGTRNAALAVANQAGKHIHLHLSTHLPEDLWIVVLREPESGGGTVPFYSAPAGDRLALPAGGTATLLYPYQRHNQTSPIQNGRTDAWIARLDLPASVDAYLEKNGFPIRYRYVPKAWPGSYYQTVYAREMGSAEMPSAGRAFSSELITELVARGVLVVPLTLHTGVSSLDDGEPPFDEFYRLPQVTALAVNTARQAGSRVIAVGTTVVRALETCTDSEGVVQPGEGWTDLLITPERGFQTVDGLLTGFHEPGSSHLTMLTSLLPIEALQAAYDEALQEGYLWHEFGDLHLILP